jgi:uncharacterized protein
LSVVLDTSVLVAAHDRGDPHHARAARFVTTVDDDLVTTPLALAEMDHLLLRGGRAPQEALWRDLELGALLVRWWADGVRDTLEIVRRHPWIGLTDASLVALTRIARTQRVATFDRHFRSLTTPDGQALTILPE